MDRDGHTAKVYADNGYDVVAMDYKGYGRSEGRKGLIRSKDELYEDCFQFVRKARQFYKEMFPEVNLSLVTIGYSIGSQVSQGVSRKIKEAGDEPLAA